jgi:hypothetical protein
MSASVIGVAGSSMSSSTTSLASALTSQGWPPLSSKARAEASGVKTWPVSAVCWA